MKGSLDGRVIQCAAQHCKILHVQDLAVHKAFSGSSNALRGTKYSLRGTNIVFRDTTVNTLRGTKWTLRSEDGGCLRRRAEFENICGSLKVSGKPVQ